MPPLAAGAECVLSDDFDSFDGTKWNVAPYFVPDFGYSCGSWPPPSETWLYFTSESGGAGDGQAHLGWKFHHTLPSPCSGQFNVTLELRWEEDNDFQMDHVRLSLDNATGDYQVNVGFEDSWSGSARGRQAVINGVRTYSGGLPLVGQATVNVVRNASSVVTATWDGLVWAQGTCTANITRIGLWLLTTQWDAGVRGGVNYLDASFTDGDYQFSDDFDYLNATLWEAEPYFSPVFGYASGHWPSVNNYLYIENTTGGAGDAKGQVGWKFYHNLPIVCDGQFEMWFGISWVETSEWQMGHVRLSLDDGSGDYQVNVGFEDSWAASTGGKAAYIGDAYTSQADLSLNGSATLIVKRDATGLVVAYWDYWSFAQGVCTAGITRVGIWLYGCKYNAGVSCGIDYIDAHFSTAETTTVDFGGLLLLAFLGVVSAGVIVLILAVHRVSGRRVAPTATAVSVASAGSAQVRCPVCGTLMDSGDQFCYRCGARRSG